MILILLIMFQASAPADMVVEPVPAHEVALVEAVELEIPGSAAPVDAAVEFMALAMEVDRPPAGESM